MRVILQKVARSYGLVTIWIGMDDFL